MTLQSERQPRRGSRPTTHHLFGALVGDLHLLEHLVPLLHDEGALVGVLRDVRVGHLDDLHLRLDPAKSVPGLIDNQLQSPHNIAISYANRIKCAFAKKARRGTGKVCKMHWQGGEGVLAASRLKTWIFAEKFLRETLRSQQKPKSDLKSLPIDSMRPVRGEINADHIYIISK